MIKEPDDVPNAPLLRWAMWICLFDFETNHVPATSHKLEDGLSQHPHVKGELIETVEEVEGFLDAFINLTF